MSINFLSVIFAMSVLISCASNDLPDADMPMEDSQMEDSKEGSELVNAEQTKSPEYQIEPDELPILEQPQTATEVAKGVSNDNSSLYNTPTGTQAYRIGPHDLIEISVFNVDELSKTVRVNEEGMIYLPLIGAVLAEGMTNQELAFNIADLLRKGYLQDPHVDIYVKEHTSQKITLEGFFKKPGIYPLSGPTTLLQAVSMGEGFHRHAKTNDVVVLRKLADTTTAYEVNLEDIRNGRTPDPVIVGGDRIIAGKSAGREVLDTIRGFISFGTL